MYHNFTFQDATEALPGLLDLITSEGAEVGSRNGRCQEVTHVGITLTEPWRREILVPERKVNIAAQIAETMWILGGRDDMAFLSNYLPRAKDFSDDGKTWRAGYGKRLRGWDDHGHAKTVDQFAECYRLLKEDPMTRRAVMSIWDPALDYAESKDIPCNNWLSWSIRGGQLDLMVAIRSNDIIWGWSGINAFEWSAMQEVMAGLLRVKVGSLHFATTSLHLYETHFSKSRKILQSDIPVGDGFDVPFTLDLSHKYDTHLYWFQKCVADWFRLEYDIRTGSPLVTGYIDAFPEPMMRAWLRVLQWWWSGGDVFYLDTINGSRLEIATHPTFAVQPKQRETEPVKPPISAFMSELCDLHLDKEKAYGGSWKKRGELFSILPNIGRKVDRLGTGGTTDDETSADTAGDLFVYLAKYHTWLELNGNETAKDANALMRDVEAAVLRPSEGSPAGWAEAWKETLIQDYETLLSLAEEQAHPHAKMTLVTDMLATAYRLARTLWEAEMSGDEYLGADVD